MPVRGLYLSGKPAGRAVSYEVERSPRFLDARESYRSQGKRLVFDPMLIIRLPYATVIHMAKATSTSILSVRVSPDERAILEAASEQAHTSLSEFVRRKALEAAEVGVLDRRVVTIAAADWAAFESWVALPAQAVPALQELARKKPTWQK